MLPGLQALSEELGNLARVLARHSVVVAACEGARDGRAGGGCHCGGCVRVVASQLEIVADNAEGGI